jgi:hypothetical protein
MLLADSFILLCTHVSQQHCFKSYAIHTEGAIYCIEVRQDFFFEKYCSEEHTEKKTCLKRLREL